MIHEVHFQPELKRVGSFIPQVGINEIATETKLHSASWKSAIDAPTPLTGAIIAALPDKVRKPPRGLYVVIDTRIHRLDVGHFPAVPGYHCDGWSRPDYHSQPNPAAVDARIRHWTGYLSSDRSGLTGTEFVTEPLLVPLDDQGKIWEQAHQRIEMYKTLEASLFETITIPPGELWEYGVYTLHRARPAHTRGWRLWFRLSWLPHKPEDLIPIEDQVYVLHEGAGW